MAATRSHGTVITSRPGSSTPSSPPYRSVTLVASSCVHARAKPSWRLRSGWATSWSWVAAVSAGGCTPFLRWRPLARASAWRTGTPPAEVPPPDVCLHAEARRASGGAVQKRTSALGGGLLRCPMPVGHEARIRDEVEIGAASSELEQRREVLLAVSRSDQTHDDLVGERRQRHGNVALPRGVEAQLEILSQQVVGEGRRVIQIHEGRGLVASERRPEHAVVDERQVIRAGDAAALGEHGGLGE